MKIPFHQIRQIFRLPVVIFLVLVLGSCLASGAIVYSILNAHLTGDCLQIKNEFVEIEFPQNWYGFLWQERNETSGNIYYAYFRPTNFFISFSIHIYDEQATENYMNDNNVTDAFSVVIREANLTYGLALESNSNATLFFIENGTRWMSGHEVYYTEFVIEGGVEQNGDFHNLTGIFLSYIDREELVFIIFGGSEDSYRQTYSIFETMLSSVEIRGWKG